MTRDEVFELAHKALYEYPEDGKARTTHCVTFLAGMRHAALIASFVGVDGRWPDEVICAEADEAEKP